MSKAVASPDSIRFGDDFELDVRAYQLRSAGIPLKLKPIPMELLLFLVERKGELVTREQIVERIWGKGVFLDTDNSINGAISKIRQVLRDDAEQPHFVQTVSGRGYRFIAPVIEAVAPPVGEQAVATQTPAPEQLIGRKISHYRILQVLGGGGMGVVYKAEDLKLGRRVAIKFLPGELSNDPKAFERFEGEARAASALDHRNICSIYQLGEYEGQPFIVMQLLEGQTLREWIETTTDPSDPQRLRQLLDVAIQIADGLDAAHQKGIIHRDIKPANIFITNRGEAKILDFGVAKFLEIAEGPPELAGSAQDRAPHASPTLTRTGASMGTPSYLSPEQIRGEKLDVRTDLFSFGLVLYEMATGRRAFAGNTAPVIREAVLNQPAVPARQLNPNLPPQLERIITKAVEKDPAARYQSAQELRADLERLRAGPAPAAPSRQHRAWGQISAVSAVIALVLFGLNVGGFRERLLHRAGPAHSVAEVKARTSVAVLGFKNLSGREEEDWISTALSEMVGTELGAGQQLRIIPSENVARMRLDLSLPTADSYGQETLKQIRNHLNTDLVVLGSYLAVGKGPDGKIRVDLQLQDAKAGETVAVISQDGSEANLADLVSRGGASLRQALGIGPLSAGDSRAVQASLPANMEAARLYAEGLSRLRVFDAVAARDLLQKAIAADPSYALAHSALAQSWSALGYVLKAQEEAKQAFALSENLPREERLSIEGRYRELSRDFPSAIEIYRTLRNFFPDDLDYGLRLASAQNDGGFAKDALQTIARMRKLPGPENKDARIDIAETDTAEHLGDFKLMQRAAAAAAAAAQVQGSRLLAAQAREKEGWAWQGLGDLGKASAALAEAQQLSLLAGNPVMSGTVLYGIANILYDKGEYDDARKTVEDARKIYLQIGSRQLASEASNMIGNILFLQGKLDEAKHQYEDKLRTDQELGAQIRIGDDYGNLGNALAGLGQLEEATRMLERSLQAFREIGDKNGEATTLTALGDLLVERGDLNAGKRMQDQAMAVEQESGHENIRGYILFNLATIFRHQDRLTDARVVAEKGLAGRKASGEAGLQAISQLQIAEIALEQGRAAEAESLARSAAESFAKDRVAGNGSEAQALLARALLAQSSLKEAQAAADRSVALSKQSTDRTIGYEAALAHAATDAESGRTAEAGKALEKLRDQASHSGYVVFDFDARLQLGLLEMKSGKVSAGRQRLQQLQKDAQGKGFLLVARKAAAALGG